MKFNHAILFLFCLMSFFVNGQIDFTSDFEVEVGKPYPFKSVPLQTNLSDSKGNVVFVRFTRKMVQVDSYDSKTMSLKGTHQLKNTNGKLFHQVEQIGDKAYLFYTERVFRDSMRLFAKEINFETGEFAKESKVLFDFRFNMNYRLTNQNYAITNFEGTTYNWDNDFPFKVYKSKSNEKVAIRFKNDVARSVFAISGYKILIGVYFFTPDLEPQGGGIFDLTKENGYFHPKNHLLSDAGNLFTFSLSYGVTGFRSYQFFKDGHYEVDSICQVPNNSHGHRPVSLEKNDSTISVFNFTYKATEHKDPWARENNVINTAEYFGLTPDNTLINRAYKTFSSEFIRDHGYVGLSKYDGTRTEYFLAKAEKVAIHRLSNQHLVQLENGNVLLFAEEAMTGSTGNNKPYYYHGNIWVLLFDSVGNCISHQKIIKRQDGSDRQAGLGYSMARINGEVYVFFRQYEKKIKDSVLCCAKINTETGSIELQNILQFEDAQGLKCKIFNSANPVIDENQNLIFEVYAGKRQFNTVKLKLKQ